MRLSAYGQYRLRAQCLDSRHDSYGVSTRASSPEIVPARLDHYGDLEQRTHAGRQCSACFSVRKREGQVIMHPTIVGHIPYTTYNPYYAFDPQTLSGFISSPRCRAAFAAS